MLGQPIYLVTPDVVGFKLSGKLPEGSTATDLVLTITQILRAHGVVDKFVEFYGPGLASMSVADRATIANMAPEYGATMGFFPVDEQTLKYMRLTGREEAHIDLVENYCRAQGLWRSDDVEPVFTETLSLDLGTVQPSVAGPKRPQDRVELPGVKQSFRKALQGFGKNPFDGSHLDRRSGTFGQPAQEVYEAQAGEDGVEESSMESFPASDAPSSHVKAGAEDAEDADNGGGTATLAAPPKTSGRLQHGDVVIAAITSCTNTSNPDVMVAAGLVAKKAVERGLTVPDYVKTSLAPGSRVVTDYLEKAGLDTYLDKLGFNTVGYGCTTCIGNSGPLPEEIAIEVEKQDLVVNSVLSGNRNFEARRWWWRTPSPAPWTSIYGPSPSATTRLARPSTSRTSGRPRRRSTTPSPPA